MADFSMSEQARRRPNRYQFGAYRFRMRHHSDLQATTHLVKAEPDDSYESLCGQTLSGEHFSGFACNCLGCLAAQEGHDV